MMIITCEKQNSTVQFEYEKEKKRNLQAKQNNFT